MSSEPARAGQEEPPPACPEEGGGGPAEEAQEAEEAEPSAQPGRVPETDSEPATLVQTESMESHTDPEASLEPERESVAASNVAQLSQQEASPEPEAKRTAPDSKEHTATVDENRRPAETEAQKALLLNPPSRRVMPNELNQLRWVVLQGIQLSVFDDDAVAEAHPDNPKMFVGVNTQGHLQWCTVLLDPDDTAPLATRIPLKSVVDIVRGKTSLVFSQEAFKDVPDECCFSVQAQTRTISMCAKNRVERDIFVRGLVEVWRDVRQGVERFVIPTRSERMEAARGTNTLLIRPSYGCNITVEEHMFVGVLLSGAQMYLYDTFDDPAPVFVMVNIKGNLFWGDSPMRDPYNEQPSGNHISLARVARILLGKQTSGLKRFNANDVPADRCFSLVSRKRILNFLAASHLQRNLWANALNFAAQRLAGNAPDLSFLIAGRSTSFSDNLDSLAPPNTGPQAESVEATSEDDHKDQLADAEDAARARPAHDEKSPAEAKHPFGTAAQIHSLRATILTGRSFILHQQNQVGRTIYVACSVMGQLRWSTQPIVNPYTDLPNALGTINLVEILQLTPGKQTQALQQPACAGVEASRCFSILSSSVSLSLEAPNQTERDLWLRCLRCAIFDLRRGVQNLATDTLTVKGGQASLITKTLPGSTAASLNEKRTDLGDELEIDADGGQVDRHTASQGLSADDRRKVPVDLAATGVAALWFLSTANPKLITIKIKGDHMSLGGKRSSPGDIVFAYYDIVKVRSGKASRVFRERTSDALTPPETCLSILVRRNLPKQKTDFVSLDLQFDNKKLRDRVQKVLTTAVMVEKLRRRSSSIPQVATIEEDEEVKTATDSGDIDGDLGEDGASSVVDASLSHAKQHQRSSPKLSAGPDVAAADERTASGKCLVQ